MIRPVAMSKAANLRALAAAARYPDRIAAAASFYGTWLVSEAEESPDLSLGTVRANSILPAPSTTKLAPLPMVEELRTLFARAPARSRAPLGAVDRALPTTLGVNQFLTAPHRLSRGGVTARKPGSVSADRPPNLPSIATLEL